MPHFLIESLPLLTRVWIHVLHMAWIWNKTKIDRRAINVLSSYIIYEFADSL